MVILYSTIIALLIVCGQALWKASVNGLAQAHVELLTAKGMGLLLKSPKLYLGVLVYGAATVGYILLLSKYKYFQVQSLVVGGSLVLTLIIAGALFSEHITILNVCGVALVLVGALLIIK